MPSSLGRMPGQLYDLLGPQEDAAQTLTNRRLRARITNAGGQTPDETGPGLIERLFDILSRPNYAVANAASNLIKPENNKPGQNVVEALLAGLSGREKTTFGDVIGEDLGVKGDDFWSRAARGVGGFALDVGLDPTTYITLGAAGGRAIGRATGTAALTRDAIQTGIKEVASETTERVADDAYREFIRGLPAGTKVTDEQARNIVDAVVGRRFQQAVIDAEQAGAAKARTRTELRFGGRTVGSTDVPARILERFRGTRDYARLRPGTQEWEGGTRLGSAIWNSRPAQTFQGMFRNEFNAPGGLNSIRNIVTGRTVAEVEKIADQFIDSLDSLRHPVTRKIPNEVLEDIARAAQTSLPPPGASPVVIEAWRMFRSIMDDLHAREEAAGLVGRYMPNYVPVYTKGGTGSAQRLLDRSRKVTDESFDKEGNFIGKPLGLDWARTAGLNPIMRADHILGHRLAEHFALMADHGIKTSAAREFGVDVSEIRRLIDHGTDRQKKNALRQMRQLEGLEGFVPYRDSKYNIDVFIPDTIDRTIRSLADLRANDRSVRNLVNFYDKVHSYWKAGATIINPGHHIRNLVGDIYMGWIDGVKNPRDYAFATAAFGEGAQEKGALYDLARSWGFGTNRSGVPTVRIGGHQITPQDLKAAYSNLGLHSSFFRAEFAFAEGFGRAPLEGLRQLSAGREEWGRLAHFLHAAKDEANRIARKNGKSTVSKAELQHAYDLAAERVRKWKFDYNDVTRFERAVGRRVTSFYTFMRKNLPAQIEAIMLRPGRSAIVPKGFEAIQQLAGTEDWRDDIKGRVPDWLREQGNPIIGGSPDQPTFLGLDLPLQEALGRFGFLAPSSYASPEQKVGRGAAEFLNLLPPAFRLPIELGTGQTTFTGADRPPLPELLLSQLPLGRQVAYNLFPDSASSNPASNLFGPQGLNLAANYLTGMGRQQATLPRQEAELRRQEDVLRAIMARLGIA